MERHEQPDELHDAPILGGLSKHDPFVVPDGFFDRFPGIVQQRIAAGDRSTRSGSIERIAWIVRRRALWFGVAAIALAVIVRTAWPEPASHADNAVEITIEPEEILSGAVDTDLLYATLGEEGTTMGTVDLPANADDLQAYLENEELPLDLLIEDL